MEQQKDAFHKLGLDNLSLEDFSKSLAQYKAKSVAEFPPPENIYKKRFPFLPAPLIEMLGQKKAQVPAANPEPNPALEPEPQPKKDLKKEEVKEKVVLPPPKKLNRFGVELQDAESLEDRIEIPEQIQNILTQYKNKAIQHEYIPMPQKEENHYEKWIDDYLEGDDDLTNDQAILSKLMVQREEIKASPLLQNEVDQEIHSIPSFNNCQTKQERT
jgi:hypothetical protein